MFFHCQNSFGAIVGLFQFLSVFVCLSFVCFIYLFILFYFIFFKDLYHLHVFICAVLCFKQ